MSLTAANAIIQLTIGTVFPVPVQLQGFSTDDVFSGQRIDTAQVQMGVDGNLSGGFVFAEYKQDYTLQADSASNDVFDGWYAAQIAASDVFQCNGIITLKTLGKKFILIKGFLTGYPPIPDAGKLVKPRKYEITWQRVLPAPV